jgi:hypothetical protein
MRAIAVTIAGVAALLLAVGGDAAYFRLHDTMPLCFAEDVGYGSEVVVVEWNRRHATSSRDIQVTVNVISPTTRTVVYTNHLRDSAGSFTFKPVSAEVGEYDVCFSAAGLDPSTNRFVELGVSIDHHERKALLPKVDPAITRAKPAGTDDEVYIFTDYDGQQKETLKTHDYIQRLQFQIVTALYEANEVYNEVNYYIGRQIRMRQTSESTFDRVWMLSVLTIVVVIGTSYVQFGYLKRYLRRKKLV